MTFFGIWHWVFQKNKNVFVVFPMKIGLALFLHYEWFLQNLEKDFIWTNMHTTLFVLIAEGGLPFILGFLIGTQSTATNKQ